MGSVHELVKDEARGLETCPLCHGESKVMGALAQVVQRKEARRAELKRLAHNFTWLTVILSSVLWLPVAGLLVVRILLVLFSLFSQTAFEPIPWLNGLVGVLLEIGVFILYLDAFFTGVKGQEGLFLPRGWWRRKG